MMEYSAMEALVADEFSFFEVEPNTNKTTIKLGVEITQYNMSNNLNVRSPRLIRSPTSSPKASSISTQNGLQIKTQNRHYL